MVYTRLHAGGKFGGGSYVATGGLHGVGALGRQRAVVAARRRGRPQLRRPGRCRSSAACPGVFDGDGPAATFTAKLGSLTKVGRAKKGVTGTRIRFWPDRQIFTKDAAFAYDELVTRARQTSFIVPGLEIVDPRRARRRAGRGDASSTTAGSRSSASSWRPTSRSPRCSGCRASDHFTETVPLLDDAGHMTPQDVERELGVDVALRWGTGYDTEVRSFVNVIATRKGGTHVAGFERALTKTFNDVIRQTRGLMKAGEADVVKDDILEGLTAVVTVRLAEPQFEGQTKEVLGTPAASRIVAKVVVGEMKAFLTSNKKAEKPQARAVLEKVVNAARTRVAARQQRDTQRRKNALESSALPAKLADCRSNDVDRSELFIVEGDSALGTAKLARDSEYQALLPIRGKILNTQKKSAGEMLQNAECASIIQVVGAGQRPHVRHRAGPLRQDHLHGRRRHRRRAHPVSAGDAVPQAHARAARPRAASTPPCRRCTGSSCPTRRRAWTSTSTPTATTSCSESSPS